MGDTQTLYTYLYEQGPRKCRRCHFFKHGDYLRIVHYVVSSNGQMVPKFFDLPRRIVEVIRSPYMINAFQTWVRGEPIQPYPSNLNITVGPDDCNFSIDFDDPSEVFYISFELNISTGEKQICLLQFTPPYHSTRVFITPDCYQRILNLPTLDHLYDVSAHVLNV